MSGWLTNYSSKWRSLAYREQDIPEELLFWLRDAKSLTYHLKELSKGQFSVDLLSYGKKRPLRDERNLLGLSEYGNAFVRQVRLLCAGQAVVFARTVIPEDTLSGKYRLLTRLGTRPLGELLFSDKSMVRSCVEVAAFPVNDRLFRGVDFDRGEGITTLWGRRSVYYLENKPLLVSEFFLPRILDLNLVGLNSSSIVTTKSTWRDSKV